MKRLVVVLLWVLAGCHPADPHVRDELDAGSEGTESSADPSEDGESSPLSASSSRRIHRSYAIVGWGDFSWVFGGTDAGMGSPAAMAEFARRVRGRGFSGLMFRTNMTLIGRPEFTTLNPDASALRQKLIDDATGLDRTFNSLRTMRGAAAQAGLDFWAWLPIVFAQGMPAQTQYGRSDWGHQSNIVFDHPEYLVVDRSQRKRYYMVPELGYEAVRADIVDRVALLAGPEFGVRNILVGLRTEADQGQPSALHGDEFGFNDVVVQDMRRRYGTDILADPRFDFRSRSFSSRDRAVEHWRQMRGTYLSRLFVELRRALDQVSPGIRVGVQIPGGNYLGPSIGNMAAQWRNWLLNGSVQALVLNADLSGGFDSGRGSKGYLTDSLSGTGVAPDEVFDQYRDTVAPKALLAKAGGLVHRDRALPASVDAWRTDMTGEAIAWAWWQRWSQWQRDWRALGYVRYIAQSFEGFPDDSPGVRGGKGDPRHVPHLRASPGWWTPIDAGPNQPGARWVSSPSQSSGGALEIPPDIIVRARHLSTSGGASPTALDPSISDGTASLISSVYLSRVNSGAVVAMRDNARAGLPIAVWFHAQKGTIHYVQDGVWVDSQVPNPAPRRWTQVVLSASIPRRTYSIRIGSSTLRASVPYRSFRNVFDELEFRSSGGKAFIDDVELRWYLRDRFASVKTPTVLLEDSFLAHPVSAAITGRAPQKGPKWDVSGEAGRFRVSHLNSYGDDVNALMLSRSPRGHGVFSGLITRFTGPSVAIDANVWSEAHGGIATLVRDGSGTIIGGLFADTATGVWRFWRGRWVATSVPITSRQWSRVHIVLDRTRRTVRYVVQGVSTVPRPLTGAIPWPSGASAGSLQLQFSPQGPSNALSFVDGVQVVSGGS